MDFIARSLDLYAEPAALYEAPRLHLVAANAAAWQWVLDLPEDQSDDTAWRESTGLGDVLRQAVADGHGSSELKWGWVHATCLPGGFEVARPDVVVASLHPETDSVHSYYEHQRLVLALRVNEYGEKAMRMLSTSISMAENVLSSNEQMLEAFNGAISDFFRLHPESDTP